jgi:DNA polymerase-3 subunit delta
MPKKNVNKNKKDDLIYVVACEDESLRNEKSNELIAQLLEPEHRTLGLLKLDASEVTAPDVFDELRTLPLLSNKRVVLIKQAEKFLSANRELLEKYFDNPSPTGILIFSVKKWDSRTKLSRKLPSIGRLISVSQVSESKLPQKLSSYAFDAHGKKLDLNKAQLLIDLIGDNLPQLYNEIDKLSLYAQEEDRITTEHIEKLTGHNRLFNCFNVIDSCLDGNTSKAVDQLRNMFAEDKSSEYTAIGAFAYHFRRMFEAKTMLQNGINTSQITKSLRVWRIKDSFFHNLQKLTLHKIGGYLQKLAATDYAIKTGQTTPRVALERLVIEMASK